MPLILCFFPQSPSSIRFDPGVRQQLLAQQGFAQAAGGPPQR